MQRQPNVRITVHPPGHSHTTAKNGTEQHIFRKLLNPTGGAALAALSSAPIPASFPDATDPVLCTGCGHGEARDQSTLAFLWPTEHGRYQARIHPPEAPRCAKCAGRMVPTPLSAHAVLARRARL